jgi:hypothetical protein
VPNYDCDPQAPDTNDFAADCVARVNQFRACVCLPPLERATDAEACVNQQAEYDASNGAHAGFLANLCQPRASAQNECPGWGGAKEVVSGCIRQMFTEGPPPTADCTGDCYTQHGHFINMTNTRYTKLACGIFSNQSETWSAQNFF